MHVSMGLEPVTVTSTILVRHSNQLIYESKVLLQLGVGHYGCDLRDYSAFGKRGALDVVEGIGLSPCMW